MAVNSNGGGRNNSFSLPNNQTFESLYTKIVDEKQRLGETAALVAQTGASMATKQQQPKAGVGGESAMLNYIYDSYAPNKHKHYDFR